jgi:uncharacterized membrane protein YhaH (DUF805 family)
LGTLESLYGILLIVLGIAPLGFFLPTLALGARRLRDAGFSPYLLFLYWLGLFGAIPLWIMHAMPTKLGTENPQSLAQ